MGESLLNGNQYYGVQPIHTDTIQNWHLNLIVDLNMRIVTTLTCRHCSSKVTKVGSVSSTQLDG